MSDNIKSFLGTGWSFPPQFLDSTQGIKMSSDEEDISESIYILLTTIPGERIMNPEYGCNLHSQAFRNIDPNTLTTIEDLISTAILYFEPRVRLESVDFNLSEQMNGRLDISITYEIKGVNSRRNLVFPYYMIEATDI